MGGACGKAGAKDAPEGPARKTITRKQAKQNLKEGGLVDDTFDQEDGGPAADAYTEMMKKKIAEQQGVNPLTGSVVVQTQEQPVVSNPPKTTPPKAKKQPIAEQKKEVKPDPIAGEPTFNKSNDGGKKAESSDTDSEEEVKTPIKKPKAVVKTIQPKPKASAQHSTAVFGAGSCFLIEAVFKRIRGVQSVSTGFSGGKANPEFESCPEKYELVMDEDNEDTGHSQVCQVTFDPDRVTFTQLLEVLMIVHDPTQHNKQGYERCRSFKSVIFYTDKSQKDASVQFLAARQKDSKKKLVTEVLQLEKFHEQEKDLQDFYHTHPEDAYCQSNIPKKLKLIEKLDIYQPRV